MSKIDKNVIYAVPNEAGDPDPPKKGQSYENVAKIRLAVFLIFLIFIIFILHRVFSGFWMLPQDFHLGPLAIHYYGLIMALAVLMGFYLALKRAPRFAIRAGQAEDILFWLVIGGFLGARLYHVLSSAGYYLEYPLNVFKVWNGGLSIYGAVLGGILTLWILKRLSTFNFQLLTVFDWLAPSVILGQIIGRFGNLFNYEAYGYPTNLPWKMFVPAIFRPGQFIASSFFHPWFLYEALGNIVILVVLLKVNKKSPVGTVAFLYLLLYNSLRFCLEFLRIDSTFIYGFRLNAVVSLLLVLIAAAGLIYTRKHAQTS